MLGMRSRVAVAFIRSFEEFACGDCRGASRGCAGRRRPEPKSVRGDMISIRKARLGSVSLSALALAMASAGHAEPALPTGGQVVTGQAQIGLPTGNSLVVDQQSNRAVIDWQSFSIGAGATVQFNNGAGATLNRVTGGDPSSIAGLMKATGSLYLINPAGVVVDALGQVLTGGSFVASTRGIGADAFMAGGNVSFVGTGNGSVQNHGQIVAGGDAVLIGATVLNSGAIKAGGTAALAAGATVTLREATGDVRIMVAGASGDVTNSGGIEAMSAELRAAGGNVYALAGSSGLVRATGTETRGGRIWLTAGKDIGVAAGATLDASANSATGSGGEIHVVTTQGRLDFKGTALAKAGAEGGDGGFIDTSGHQGIDVGGAVISASAANGKAGNWLIDPFNITINLPAANSISSALNGNTNVTIQTTGASTGSPGFGTVTPNAAGDIIVTSGINWSTAATLTLDAWRNIVLDGALGGNASSTIVLKIGQAGGVVGAGSSATQTAPVNTGTLQLFGPGNFVLNGANVTNDIARIGTSSFRALGIRSTQNLTVGDITADIGAKPPAARRRCVGRGARHQDERRPDRPVSGQHGGPRYCRAPDRHDSRRCRGGECRLLRQRRLLDPRSERGHRGRRADRRGQVAGRSSGRNGCDHRRVAAPQQQLRLSAHQQRQQSFGAVGRG